MTIKEYNETICKETKNADVFICTLDHAMQKTGHYEEALHQLQCSGWSSEVKATIRKALEFYRNFHKEEAKYEAYAPTCSDHASAVIAKLRRMGLSNGSSLGYHSAVADDAADLIEQYISDERSGRLLRLPCVAGDTVYKICPQAKHLQYGMMWGGKVIDHCCDRCPWRNSDCTCIGFQSEDHFEHTIMEIIVPNLSWLVTRLPYFNSIYFTSETSARKHLKELEGATDV